MVSALAVRFLKEDSVAFAESICFIIEGESIVLGEHHEGGGDKVEDPVQPLHSATAGEAKSYIPKL